MIGTCWRLSISGIHHRQLIEHLFPGDGLEAAAILLCGRTSGCRPRLCVRDIIPVPHSDCQRERDHLSWPSGILDTALERANSEELSLILTHSHPTGLWSFSGLDDESDQDIVPDLMDELRHKNAVVGTAVAVPGGALKARLYDSSFEPIDIEHVQVCGDDIHFFFENRQAGRAPMAFTSGMRSELCRLTACVVGASGTGSIVAEQLARLGFGKIILIDPDRIEIKNLNRILNARVADAKEQAFKVDRLKEAILSFREDVEVCALSKSIESREAILAAAESDVLFCCVDTATGRQVCDLISNSFVIPLFDIGVTIPTAMETDLGRVVADVVGRVSYVQPGLSSLEDRGVYTQRTLRAEELAANDPRRYAREVAEGYIDGMVDEAPSVITLNMRAAAAIATEFIARSYPYRFEENCLYAQTEFSLADMSEEHFPENTWTAKSAKYLIGRGIREPLLNIPGLQENGMELTR
ncbi:MAG: ThiF family adenylyltransferase [Parvibaculaceae bacterium]